MTNPTKRKTYFPSDFSLPPLYLLIHSNCPCVPDKRRNSSFLFLNNNSYQFQKLGNKIKACYDVDHAKPIYSCLSQAIYLNFFPVTLSHTQPTKNSLVSTMRFLETIYLPLPTL